MGNAAFGSEGVWAVIFTFDLIERVAQNLRRTILLHFGLIAFRIHFPVAPNVTILCFVGLGGRVHDSQNQLS